MQSCIIFPWFDNWEYLYHISSFGICILTWFLITLNCWAEKPENIKTVEMLDLILVDKPRKNWTAKKIEHCICLHCVSHWLKSESFFSTNFDFTASSKKINVWQNFLEKSSGRSYVNYFQPNLEYHELSNIKVIWKPVNNIFNLEKCVCVRIFLN